MNQSIRHEKDQIIVNGQRAPKRADSSIWTLLDFNKNYKDHLITWSLYLNFLLLPVKTKRSILQVTQLPIYKAGNKADKFTAWPGKLFPLLSSPPQKIKGHIYNIGPNTLLSAESLTRSRYRSNQISPVLTANR